MTTECQTPALGIHRQVDQAFQKGCNRAASFLDRHPAVYKTALFACHLFRSAGMYGMMLVMPGPFLVKGAIALSGSLLYRAAIERFCCFRFTLLSLAGGLSMQAARPALASLAAGSALTTLSLAWTLPLAAWTVAAVYVSHRDIEVKFSARSCCAH